MVRVIYDLEWHYSCGFWSNFVRSVVATEDCQRDAPIGGGDFLPLSLDFTNFLPSTLGFMVTR